MKEKLVIPEGIARVVGALRAVGFEAYPVGGCVRDILLGIEPNDWDVTTSAKPEEILQLFTESFYENKFLTVTVKTGSDDPALSEIEITTFRAEGKYTDKRHPDEVRYAQTLKEDLSRRDFTINALAIRNLDSSIQHLASSVIDPFGGQDDLKKKLIRSVGNPEERFGEDALRMLRAVRLAMQLDFTIEEKTFAAIKKHAGALAFIAKERIRDEMIKLEYAAHAKYPLDVRIAALLHDVAKPATRGPMKNDEWTFYGHDVVGGKMAAEILTRLHFPHAIVEKIATLIRWHLFKYDPDEGITDASIRRLIRNVGRERMDDLVRVRICDRMGMGVPKPLPYRLRHFQFRVEKILREEDAPRVKMLKINGNDVMNILVIPPGPKIGKILEVLLQEIIDDPEKNVRERLLERVQEVGVLPDDKLTSIAEEAESRVEILEDQRESAIKQKYWVK
ncbi:MAG: putative domain HDIG [Parcubacteria group bacterium Gr01-1014_66]|nr:MAG: putative domain HDIG [Parcubacteria group bacterium Gr01-1014_66]